jgi:hypothetical protein
MNYLQSLHFDFVDMLNFEDRPFRAKIIPSKIWKDLDNYKNNSKALVNYVKKWRCKLEWVNTNSKAKVFQTYVEIGGEYDPDKRQSTLIIHTTNFDNFPFTEKSWDAFKYRITGTLMHEIIHFMQFHRRDDEWSNYVVPYKKIGHEKKDAERAYLSEFDEIQAYAHCVYLDFKSFRPNIPIETLLNRCKTHRDSKTLHYFLKTFDYDFRNNVSPQKIIQQITKWERKYNRMT